MLIALPLSKFLMSVAQFYLVGLWLFDKRLLEKWREFFSDRAAMVLVSIYIIHVIGLLWTTDFHYAAKDLRIKLPLLALPVIIATSPRISARVFNYLMLIFIAANVVGSFFSMHELLTKDIVEIRKISLFMSHIRFSLNICVAVFVGFYLVFGSRFFRVGVKVAIFTTVLWLIIFLGIMESITGIAIALLVASMLILLTVYLSEKLWLKNVLFVVLITAPMIIFIYLSRLYDDYKPDGPFIYEGMDVTTSRGNYYGHDTTLKGAENGNWIGQYIQYAELEEAWNNRSELAFNGMDKTGHYLRFTLIRYLTSKGLRKDYDGVEALSDADITNIENGIANHRHVVESSLQKRLRMIVWEMMLYRESGYLSGHSVAQRIEFWRAATRIIKHHFWLGTGTGDIDNAFKDEYNKMNSQLEQQFRWRAHNQYITMVVQLGLFGFLWFMFALIYPARKLHMYRDYYYLVFFAILMLSMLTEDTLESQAGATFFAFFTTFFLFARKDKNLLFIRKNKAYDE
jgi:hypothetical protein